jgi:hypothetical protein
MPNKSALHGIYLISGFCFVLGLIYLSYGLIGRVSFLGEVSDSKRIYLGMVGALAIGLSYGICARKEIARKILVTLAIAVSLIGPVKVLGCMMYQGEADSARIIIQIIELITYISPAIYLTRTAVRQFFVKGN